MHHYKNIYKEDPWKTPWHDSIKNEFCSNNNIRLLRIPYWDLCNIENILEKELKMP